MVCVCVCACVGVCVCVCVCVSFSPLVQPLYQSARLTLKRGETLTSSNFGGILSSVAETFGVT